MLVFLAVGVLATFLRYAGGASSDPEEQVQSLCTTAVQDDLERRGSTVEQLPLFSDVEQVDDTGQLAAVELEGRDADRERAGEARQRVLGREAARAAVALQVEGLCVHRQRG